VIDRHLEAAKANMKAVFFAIISDMNQNIVSEMPQLRIKDPEMKDTLWSTVESLESLFTMGSLNQWKTWTELEDRYGK
jgi:hypothetical protein